jgi:hypothetical protein
MADRTKRRKRDEEGSSPSSAPSKEETEKRSSSPKKKRKAPLLQKSDTQPLVNLLQEASQPTQPSSKRTKRAENEETLPAAVCIYLIILRSESVFNCLFMAGSGCCTQQNCWPHRPRLALWCVSPEKIRPPSPHLLLKHWYRRSFSLTQSVCRLMRHDWIFFHEPSSVEFPKALKYFLSGIACLRPLIPQAR